MLVMGMEVVVVNFLVIGGGGCGWRCYDGEGGLGMTA